MMLKLLFDLCSSGDGRRTNDRQSRRRDCGVRSRPLQKKKKKKEKESQDWGQSCVRKARKKRGGEKHPG